MIPAVRNPADWFMDVISGKVDNAAEPGLKSTALAQKWWHGPTLDKDLPTSLWKDFLTNVFFCFFLVERKTQKSPEITSWKILYNCNPIRKARCS